MSSREAAWPALPLDGWRPTKDTLHRYRQMVGKVRLALSPFRNHWWHVTLYVDADGLTTGPMPLGAGRTAELRLDLRDHAVHLHDSDGAHHGFALHDRLPCADFHDQLVDVLDPAHHPT